MKQLVEKNYEGYFMSGMYDSLSNGKSIKSGEEAMKAQKAVTHTILFLALFSSIACLFWACSSDKPNVSATISFKGETIPDSVNVGIYQIRRNPLAPFDPCSII